MSLNLLINNATVLVKKKNGTFEEFDSEKIISAVERASKRCVRPLSDQETNMILITVENQIISLTDNVVSVERIHAFVEDALEKIRPDVANSYINYRNVRKSWAKMQERIDSKTNSLLFLGDKSNANADSRLASTIGCLITGYQGTEMTENHFLYPRERQAINEGYIKVHNMDKRYWYSLNCCIFDLESVLSGGFEMSNVWYNEPKTLDTAFDVLGDVILSGSSQQYGGFTIPEVDKLLEPYAEKSYKKYYAEEMASLSEVLVDDLKFMKQQLLVSGLTEDNAEILIDTYKQNRLEEFKKKADEKATAKVTRDMYQGFQGWEYKFNTVASSRGDYPFITATFGLQTSKWGKLASIAILDVRREGQGKKGYKKPVLFPKLVFLYDEKLHGPEKELEDVFEAGIKCSAKTMYPDWLSLSGKGYVAEMYQKYGVVISPMGCRAFLSPWFERGGFEPADENDKPIFTGRFNIGVVSLHLPLIYQNAKVNGKDFFSELDYYLEMIRDIHCRTYDWIGQMPASRNPLAFCEGGLHGGHLALEDKIAPVLKSATASFGITALNELQQLYNKKSLVEDGQFALDVMIYINKKIEQFKKEDKHLYAVYGTPAESLCGLQVKQFRKKFGIIKNVSDREYVSNSFHCHVTENISPIEKQDLEYRFWNLSNGGKIQYVKYPIGYNLSAMRTLVRRAMELGFYEGVNLSLSFCDDCGKEFLDGADICPRCGSKNLTKIDRMNGYLAYSRVKGDTRLNDAKMAEIKERVSM